MKRPFLLCGILGFLAVMLGAFGAHGLEGKLEPKALNAWVTANRYHFIHTLALFGLAHAQVSGYIGTARCRACWILGLTFFSGGLYIYALTGLKLFALVAPLGGLSYAAGWLFLGGLERSD